jgi:hypothetical protein
MPSTECVRRVAKGTATWFEQIVFNFFSFPSAVLMLLTFRVIDKICQNYHIRHFATHRSTIIIVDVIIEKIMYRHRHPPLQNSDSFDNLHKAI